ncbi:ferric reductase-like transmembrane domain-containing protein [Streptomyces sp. NPDC051976]|uniref:ferric reductase-like transmembrane domain-containing protein n=1 Tax=Streptomyces sp. NPDC051976 TaxID=3154947 RepID=UPI003441486B
MSGGATAGRGAGRAGPRHRGGRRPNPAPARPWRRADPGAVLLGALLLGATAVTASWWATGGLPAGAGGLVASGARLSGLLAGYTGIVLLGLMARVPLLERTVGTAQLVRGHSVAGRCTIGLACVHTVLATAHWTSKASGTLWQRLTGRLGADPRLQQALVALVLLLAVAAVSARAARRHLGHGIWHRVHLTTYAAMALALTHELAGPDLVAAPAVRAAWWLLCGVVVYLLVHHRLIAPPRRALRHRLQVAEVRHEAPGVVSVLVTGRDLPGLGAEPGQFFRWRFLTRGMWWTANPYSLSAPPGDCFLRITVKAAGTHSQALTQVRPGTRVWAQGPYGALTRQAAPAPKVLLLGGGIGIAPLRALFETLPGKITFVYRARGPEDLVLRAELEAIAAARGARVLYVLDGPHGPSLPLTGRALRAAVPDLAAHVVYLTGPPGMTATARRALRRAGVPRRSIRCESFDF